MTGMLEVKLEMLRAGPAHNQLLSPLTPYLGLCGDGGPVTFHIPLEHRELLNRLERLMYTGVQNNMREAELEELGRFAGSILGDIKTLGPELCQAVGSDGQSIHLRLILSGSELALLPFEVAVAPQSFPGEGLPLLLQQNAPVTMTREVRRGRPLSMDWDRAPRILFITAEPRGLNVPTQQHIVALRAALEPWIRWEQEPEARVRHVSSLLTVATNASVQEIRRLCAEGNYTHVHILAHGHPYDIAGGERRHGVALCDERTPQRIDVVSGRRLAQALRATHSDSAASSRPSVVTLMTCDSGNQATVTSPGGSVAHDLHAFGIPWVFASQFPLTKSGSVRITRSLYKSLLEGEDPRFILRDLRNLLRTSSAKDHDWASLVAYIGLSDDFDVELKRFRDRQRRKAIEVAFDRATRAHEIAAGHDPKDEKLEALIDDSIADIRRRLQHWESEINADGDLEQLADAVEGYGMRAAMEKRVALLSYDRKRPKDGDQALTVARDYYEKAMQQGQMNHWTATQFLSLSAVLGKNADNVWWVLARHGAENDLKAADKETRAWAYGSLAELTMLEVTRKKSPDVKTATETVTRHCRDLVALMGKGSFAVFSTQRQFQRYLDWWQNKRWDEIASAATKALGALPDTSELPPDRR